MISEKTVELNITTEMVRYFRSCFGYSRSRYYQPYILAPSQNQETTLGYDVQIGLSLSKSVFIQYKRAEPISSGLEYHINYTSRKNQHYVLKHFEKMGNNVFYALPLFYEDNFVIRERGCLLLHMAFISPSKINPMGGDIGKHKIVYNTASQNWMVFSEKGVEIEKGDIMDINDIWRIINQKPAPPEKAVHDLNLLLEENKAIDDIGFYSGNLLLCL
jgi:hypothetical protein